MRHLLQYPTKAALPIILLTACSAVAQITPLVPPVPPVINVPGDPVPGQVLADQTLNLYDGGEVDTFLTLNSNSTLNIYGGSISGDLVAEPLSTINISGGLIDGLYGWFQSTGAVINISGGEVNAASLTENSGNTINITGGTLGGTYLAPGNTINLSQGSIETILSVDGTFNMTGGVIDGSLRLDDDGTAIISGGRFGWQVRTDTGSSLTLTGGDFRLDGAPIAGLDSIGNTVDFDIPEGSTLSGTLSDGTVFIITPPRENNSYTGGGGDSVADGTLTLQASSVPSTPTHFNVPTDAAPNGLRAGQTLTLTDGGSIPKYFAAVDATISITGGTIEGGFELSNTSMTITGGDVGDFEAHNGSIIQIQGGKVNFGQYTAGSSAIISGGAVQGLAALDDTQITITGGAITDHALAALSGSKVDFFGGSFHQLHIEDGADFNLHGGQFMLDGVPIEGLDSPGSFVDFTPSPGSILTGTLTDGTVIAVRGYSDPSANGSISLISTAIPQSTQQVFYIPTQPAPRGLNAGQSLYLSDGGSLDYNFVAIDASIDIDGGTVNDGLRLINTDLLIRGGEVGEVFAHRNSQVSINGGHVAGLYLQDNSTGHITGGTFVDVNAGGDATLLIDGDTTIETLYVDSSNTVHLTDGAITERVHLVDNSTLHMHGGSISADIDSFSLSSQLIISGGSFDSGLNGFLYHGDILIRGGDIGGSFTLLYGNDMTISGGSLLPDLVLELEDEYATLNFIGQSFMLNGVSVSDDMLPGDTLIISDNNAALQGILADGSPFHFGNLSFKAVGQLSITLVPEPATLSLFTLALLFNLKRRD